MLGENMLMSVLEGMGLNRLVPLKNNLKNIYFYEIRVKVRKQKGINGSKNTTGKFKIYINLNHVQKLQQIIVCLESCAKCDPNP